MGDLSDQETDALKTLLKQLLLQKKDTERQLDEQKKADKRAAELARWERIQRRAGTFTPEEWKLRATYDEHNPNGAPVALHPIPENGEKGEHAGSAYCMCHGKLLPLDKLLFVRPGWDGSPGFVCRDVAKRNGWVEYIL